MVIINGVVPICAIQSWGLGGDEKRKRETRRGMVRREIEREAKASRRFSFI